jgi:hypothetical protein
VLPRGRFRPLIPFSEPIIVPRANHPVLTPKQCPGCGKTTIKVYCHDIMPWVDEIGADPILWQCVSCGLVMDREGGSGRIVGAGYDRVTLAPGDYEALTTYQTKRNRRKV